MWMACVALVGAWIGLAQAADLPEAPPAPQEAPFAAPKNPLQGAAEQVQEQRSAEEQAAAERERRLAAAQGQKVTRVVVLKWPDSKVDHKSDGLKRNTQARIGRPSAKFYPEIDLYQVGRREPEEGVGPLDQRVSVPKPAIELVMESVREVQTLDWNDLSESRWAKRADQLRSLVDEIWFVDRPELRKPLFHLYLQIGRAATNASLNQAPWFQIVDDENVNYYWYLAGALAWETPDLLNEVTDPDLKDKVRYYKSRLDDGSIGLLNVSFESEGFFDPPKFAGEYQVFINGREIEVSDPDGIVKVPRGRIDVFLKRPDGFSMSETAEVLRFDDRFEGKVWFVRDTARKRMGTDFLKQLMEHPNDCFPDLDEDILTSMSIYAKLHPEAEIYIVIPKAGSANNIYVWRYDRAKGLVERVVDETGGYPIRFAALMGAGLSFNSAAVDYDVNAAAQAAGENVATGSVAPPDFSGLAPKLTPAGVPTIYHLRAHYNRLMVTTGIEFQAGLNGPFQDVYQTDGNPVWKEGVTETGAPLLDENGNPVLVAALRERDFQRLVFFGVGVVLLKDAGFGIGPRGWLRVGWTNVPHAVDLTAHVGITEDIPTKAKGRVRPIIDGDFFGGVLLPVKDSMFPTDKPLPQFGFTAAVGLTF
jgi:hypothetical protein